jgi:hypothetical protein
MYIIDGSLRTARGGLSGTDLADLAELELLELALASDELSPASLGLGHWGVSLRPETRTTAAWRRAIGLNTVFALEDDTFALDLVPPLRAVTHA